MKRPVYLDYHATTPCDPRVVEAMAPCYTEAFGNPSSSAHSIGRAAQDLVEDARRRVADVIGAQPSEIVFTSGATEANNLAILGAAHARRESGDGNHVICCRTEHKSVIRSVERLEEEGFTITWLPVDHCGRIDVQTYRDALTEETVLVSLMFGNNEIGTIHPIAEFARRAHEGGAWFHTDAVQAIGKIGVDVDDLDVDLLSLSGHKIYGPKGVGALYVRERPRRVKLEPVLLGGGHERGRRSGTLNVPGIVGLARALELAVELGPEENERIEGLRDRLQGRLCAGIDDLIVNCETGPRLPNNLSVSIPNVDGEALLLSLEDVAVSSGSACNSSASRTSHVLKALGRDDETGAGTIRFGLGRWTTEEEVDYAARRVIDVAKQLRSLIA